MVDHAALSWLIDDLQSLKYDDGKGSGGYEQLWGKDTVESLKNLDYWFESPSVLSEARSTLRKLGAVKSVLTGISDSLEQTVMDIQKHILPLELGRVLFAIPDEVLSMIFNCTSVYCGGRAFTLIRNQSLVCRRFRIAVINTPHLWTHIDSLYKMSYVRACLKRSKSVGLSICVTFNNKDTWDRSLSFLAVILPHSTRWEQFDVSFDLTEVGSNSALRQKFLQSADLSNLHLPSLNSLHLYYKHYEEYLTGGTMHDIDDTLHFYHSWKMPNLRLFATDGFPKTIDVPQLPDLRLNSDLRGPSAREHLRNLFAGFPALEKLYIDLSRVDGQDFDHTFAIDMPNLRTLVIRALEYDSTGIHSFMGALRAPALCEVEILMTPPEDEDAKQSALDDFFPHNDYPALEDLTLKMYADESTVLRVPFAKFRGLRSLSLDTSSLASYIPCLDADKEEDFIPALRKIKVTKCDNSYLPWLNVMRDSLMKKGLWAGFKELEIHSALTPSFLREINRLYGEENKVVSWNDKY